MTALHSAPALLSHGVLARSDKDRIFAGHRKVAAQRFNDLLARSVLGLV